jgi:cell division protein FtsQ
MGKIKTILRITSLTLFAATIATGSIFVIVKTAENQDTLKIKDVNITIRRSGKIIYLQQKDIENYLFNQHKISLIGEKINDISTSYIETLLDENPYIKHSEVYAALDGTIYLDIQQRNPILKVYNMYGEIFNVDENGIIMPNNSEYPAHIRVANGNIAARYKNGDTAKNTLHNIFVLSQYLSTDTITDALVEQLYINAKNNIILVPKIGNVTITFGRITDMEQKIKKIKDFYAAVPSFNKSGKYSILDARFKNQIIGIWKTT